MADPLDLLERTVPPLIASQMFDMPVAFFAGIAPLTLRSAFRAAYGDAARAFYERRCRKRSALMNRIAADKQHRHSSPRTRVSVEVAARAEAKLRARLGQILGDAADQIEAADPVAALRLRLRQIAASFDPKVKSQKWSASQ